MAIRDVTVTRAGLDVITTGLAQPGWAKTPKLIFIAGKLGVKLDEEHADAFVAPEGDDVSDEDAKAAQKAFAYKDIVLKLTDNEYDGVKACLKYHIEQGNILPTPHTAQLCEAFGLVGDEE
jgi:hypothetical protein